MARIYEQYTSNEEDGNEKNTYTYKSFSHGTRKESLENLTLTGIVRGTKETSE